jgi:reactive intermediate/imine deaminase
MKRIMLLAGACASLLTAGTACAADAPQTKPTSSIKNVEFLNSGRFAHLPFSDGVRVGNLTYFSGEIGDVEGSDKLVPGGIKAEAKQALTNIKHSVEANGYKMSDIVKCTVMLADMGEWPAFNEVYKTFFVKPYPARSAFGVSGLAFDARVELECIAAR